MIDSRRLVVCETMAAITLHLRALGPDEEPMYTGHHLPAPRTLCGRAVGWDTRIPLGQERCTTCIAERDKLDD